MLSFTEKYFQPAAGQLHVACSRALLLSAINAAMDLELFEGVRGVGARGTRRFVGAALPGKHFVFLPTVDGAPTKQ